MIGVNHKTVSKIRKMLENGQNIFIEKNELGRPPKVTNELVRFVEQMTLSNRRMTNLDLSIIISQCGRFEPVSKSTVSLIRKSLGFKYLPPVRTFALTSEQKIARINFLILI